jgi:hypothetical protein
MLGARSCRSAETQTRAHPGDLRDRIASAEAEARTGTEIELRKKSPRAWLLQNRKPTVQSQPEPEPPRRGHRRALRVDIAKVEKLASRALTIEQIAPRIGMARQTLFTKRRLNPAIYDAIEKGKAAGIEEMANKLFDDGLAGNTTAQIFYLKARAGWRDARRACRSAAVRLRAAFPSRPAGSTVRGTRSKETVMTRSRKRRVPQAEISRSCPPGSPSLRRNPMVAVSMPSPSLGMAELAIEHLDVEATEQTNERCSA